MRTTNPRIRGQRGQTLVESALVIIVLLCTLLGIIDFGQVLFFHQTLVERARAGVRWAAVQNPIVTGDVQNYVIYNNSAGTGTPILGSLTSSNVVVTQTGQVGCDDSRVTVQIVNYPFQFFAPYLAKTFVNKPIVETLPWEAPATAVCP